VKEDYQKSTRGVWNQPEEWLSNHHNNLSRPQEHSVSPTPKRSALYELPSSIQVFQTSRRSQQLVAMAVVGLEVALAYVATLTLLLIRY
jgi:hypothetical protein